MTSGGRVLMLGGLAGAAGLGLYLVFGKKAEASTVTRGLQDEGAVSKTTLGNLLGRGVVYGAIAGGKLAYEGAKWGAKEAIATPGKVLKDNRAVGAGLLTLGSGYGVPVAVATNVVPRAVSWSMGDSTSLGSGGLKKSLARVGGGLLTGGGLPAAFAGLAAPKLYNSSVGRTTRRVVTKAANATVGTAGAVAKGGASLAVSGAKAVGKQAARLKFW
jgi:hypothetical protein